MIVLDHDSVVKTVAVTGGSAHFASVLVKESEAREGFSSGEELGI